MIETGFFGGSNADHQIEINFHGMAENEKISELAGIITHMMTEFSNNQDRETALTDSYLKENTGFKQLILKAIEKLDDSKQEATESNTRTAVLTTLLSNEMGLLKNAFDRQVEERASAIEKETEYRQVVEDSLSEDHDENQDILRALKKGDEASILEKKKATAFMKTIMKKIKNKSVMGGDDYQKMQDQIIQTIIDIDADKEETWKRQTESKTIAELEKDLVSARYWAKLHHQYDKLQGQEKLDFFGGSSEVAEARLAFSNNFKKRIQGRVGGGVEGVGIDTKDFMKFIAEADKNSQQQEHEMHDDALQDEKLELDAAEKTDNAADTAEDTAELNLETEKDAADAENDESEIDEHTAELNEEAAKKNLDAAGRKTQTNIKIERMKDAGLFKQTPQRVSAGSQQKTKAGILPQGYDWFIVAVVLMFLFDFLVTQFNTSNKLLQIFHSVFFLLLWAKIAKDDGGTSTAGWIMGSVMLAVVVFSGNNIAAWIMFWSVTVVLLFLFKEPDLQLLLVFSAILAIDIFGLILIEQFLTLPLSDLFGSNAFSFFISLLTNPAIFYIPWLVVIFTCNPRASSFYSKFALVGYVIVVMMGVGFASDAFFAGGDNFNAEKREQAEQFWENVEISAATLFPDPGRSIQCTVLAAKQTLAFTKPSAFSADGGGSTENQWTYEKCMRGMPETPPPADNPEAHVVVSGESTWYWNPELNIWQENTGFQQQRVEASRFKDATPFSIEFSRERATIDTDTNVDDMVTYETTIEWEAPRMDWEAPRRVDARVQCDLVAGKEGKSVKPSGYYGFGDREIDMPEVPNSNTGVTIVTLEDIPLEVTDETVRGTINLECTFAERQLTGNTNDNILSMKTTIPGKFRAIHNLLFTTDAVLNNIKSEAGRRPIGGDNKAKDTFDWYLKGYKVVFDGADKLSGKDGAFPDNIKRGYYLPSGAQFVLDIINPDYDPIVGLGKSGGSVTLHLGLQDIDETLFSGADITDIVITTFAVKVPVQMYPDETACKRFLCESEEMNADNRGTGYKLCRYQDPDQINYKELLADERGFSCKMNIPGSQVASFLKNPLPGALIMEQKKFELLVEADVEMTKKVSVAKATDAHLYRGTIGIPVVGLEAEDIDKMQTITFKSTGTVPRDIYQKDAIAVFPGYLEKIGCDEDIGNFIVIRSNPDPKTGRVLQATYGNLEKFTPELMELLEKKPEEPQTGATTPVTTEEKSRKVEIKDKEILGKVGKSKQCFTDRDCVYYRTQEKIPACFDECNGTCKEWVKNGVPTAIKDSLIESECEPNRCGVPRQLQAAKLHFELHEEQMTADNRPTLVSLDPRWTLKQALREQTDQTPTGT
ncbi:MAG: hypothetical protein ABIC95_05790 [archaeon]